MSDSNNTIVDGVPIPQGWTRGVSKTLNRPYYYHRESRHTQWHFPTPTEAKDPDGTKQRMLQNNNCPSPFSRIAFKWNGHYIYIYIYICVYIYKLIHHNRYSL